MKLSKKHVPVLGKTYDALKHCFIVLDEHFNVLYINNYAKKLLDFEDSELIGKQSFITLLQKHNFSQLLNATTKTVNPEPMRIKKFLKKWQLIKGIMADKNVFFLFDKDVTEQEELYDVLARAVSEITGQVFSNRLSPQYYMDEIRGCLESVIKQMPCYVYWKDRNFNYIFCNDITAEIMGLSSAEEAIGKTDYDFGWEEELVDSYRETDKKILATGSPVLNLEEELINKDGRIYQTLVNKMPLKNKKGEIIGILGITVDITGVKKAEVAKANFISNMEHDLKTPFSGIGGIANILFEMETDPEKKELLGLMVKSCKQWEEVHHRIFDSLVVELPSHLRIEALSISKEIRDIYEMMSATLYLKKLDFVIEPISVDRDKIKTDKEKFRLILSSLISNAINFTEQGGVTIRVFQEKDNCIIQVIDTGIGIPDDQFETIFEKFSKLSRSNKGGGNFTGVGLGLYVARQYATQIGATISVESTVGKGSTFILELPIKNIQETSID